MEVRRIREIADVARDAFERGARDGLAAHLEQRGVSETDVAEALQDVDRLGPEEAEGVGSLLRMTLAQIGGETPPSR